MGEVKFSRGGAIKRNVLWCETGTGILRSKVWQWYDGDVLLNLWILLHRYSLPNICLLTSSYLTGNQFYEWTLILNKRLLTQRVELVICIRLTNVRFKRENWMDKTSDMIAVDILWRRIEGLVCVFVGYWFTMVILQEVEIQPRKRTTVRFRRSGRLYSFVCLLSVGKWFLPLVYTSIQCIYKFTRTKYFG